MRVLQINSVCGIGSTGRIAAEIQQLLHAGNHECLIAYGRGPVSRDCVGFRIGSMLSVASHGVYSRLADRHGFGSSGATRRLVGAIEAYAPDVVHLHNLHGYYLNVELLAHYLHRSQIPVVWTLHDAWAITGHCAHFESSRCERWKTGCYECPLKHEYPRSLVLDRSRDNWRRKREAFAALNRCVVVVPSVWLARHVADSFLNACSVHLIRNGVDTETFRYSPSSFRDDYDLVGRRVILAVAGRWTHSKGFEDVLEVARLLRHADLERRGREYHRVVMVGLSEKQMRTLPAWITGLPRTSSARALAEVYSAADVFINPTHDDNYPTVNLEALACGLPVLTYDTGGSGECLLESRFGRVVGSSCPSDMVDCILAGDIHRFDVDDRVRDSLSSHVQMKQYLGVYRSLVDCRDVCGELGSVYR
ncbi:MAG: glycosyltransferase [Coriobacteriia bacterium]|nr:glycosyltransferase [Coriobacteriia bacterium]